MPDIAAIREKLAREQAADATPKGLRRLFERASGQAMKNEFDRQARATERTATATAAIEAVKIEVRAERNALVAGQVKDSKALTDRHTAEDVQMNEAARQRQAFDRTAEVEGRKQAVQEIRREREPGPGQERGRGMDLTPR